MQLIEPTRRDVIVAIDRANAVLDLESVADRWAHRIPPLFQAGFTSITAARPFMAAFERFCCVCAGVRGGKSMHSCVKFVVRIGKDDGKFEAHSLFDYETYRDVFLSCVRIYRTQQGHDGMTVKAYQ